MDSVWPMPPRRGDPAAERTGACVEALTGGGYPMERFIRAPAWLLTACLLSWLVPPPAHSGGNCRIIRFAELPRPLQAHRARVLKHCSALQAQRQTRRDEEHLFADLGDGLIEPALLVAKHAP